MQKGVPEGELAHLTRLFLATRNRGKLREITRILEGLPLEVVGLGEFPDFPPVEETGETFLENALLKARAAASFTGLPSLADDSGLEVDALRGAPGVMSSRYAGKEGDDAANVARLLREMEGIPEKRRGARFVCVLVLAHPDGRWVSLEGTCRGRIATSPRGTGGFGYDPVFIPEGMDRTMAQLSLEEKNALSHRGAALRALREMLEKREPSWLWES